MPKIAINKRKPKVVVVHVWLGFNFRKVSVSKLLAGIK